MSREVKRKRRKLSVQKMFNFVSASFILACCIFYGTRFIKLYLSNKKEIEVNSLASDIIKNSKLKEMKGKYYFVKNADDNYLNYSNLSWRVISINEDKSITAVLEHDITSLAPGENENFEDSYINKWLNNQKENSTGILEKNLNNKEKYLINTKTCNDTINDLNKINCNTVTKDLYITIPSINDYINTGGNESFMYNGEYFYLINYDSDGKEWYVNDAGKVDTSDNTDILGIKPVITIKNSVTLVKGTGKKDDPYKIESESGLFGSYVNLDDSLWRITDVSDNNVKLTLDSYLKINDHEVTYQYSNNNYYHNDTMYGSLAYYLKNNYLINTDFNDKIKEENFPNGLYSNTTDFDYTKTLNSTVPTKIAPISIGDIILNPKLTNYYMSTGIEKESGLIYVMNDNFNINTKSGTEKLKIVPTIQIKKDLLINGDGTKESPYEV